MSIRIATYEPSRLASYARFAESAYGRGAYQASPAYLSWLYRERPEDLLVAVTDAEEVVGCVHKLRLPWLVGRETIDVAAVHNWMVLPAHRGGTGLRLFLAALAPERHAFVPGSGPASAAIHDKLRGQEAPVAWYRWPLLAWNLEAVRAGLRGLWSGQRARRRRAEETATRLSPLAARSGLGLTASPDPDDVARIAGTLARSPTEGARPRWSPETTAWRFFAPEGPRHLALGTPGWDEVALLSLGWRHRLLVGRIVELRARSPEGVRDLVAASGRILAGAGAQLMMHMTADVEARSWLAQVGHVAVAAPPRAFFHNRKHQEALDRFSFSGGAGDVGLEAFDGPDALSTSKTNMNPRDLVAGERAAR